MTLRSASGTLRSAGGALTGVGPARPRSAWSAAVTATTSASSVDKTPVSYPNAVSVVIGTHRYTTQSPDKAYSFAAVADPLTPTYERYELRQGDRWINDINQFPNDARERCMLRDQAYAPAPSTLQDTWTSFSMRVTATAFRTGASFYNILTEWFSEQEGAEAPVAQSGKHGCWTLRIEDSGSGPRQKVRIYGDPSGAATTTSTTTSEILNEDFAPFNGVWQKIVIRSRFHWNAGQFQMWRNGTQILNLSGLSMGYNDTKGPYYKKGIYRTGSPYGVVVEFANSEVGTTSLSGRVASPLALPGYAVPIPTDA